MITVGPGRATGPSSRSALLGLIATAAALCGVVFAGGAANAETAYRYWSFWVAEEEAWTYAQVGPASVAVEDGDVFGWSFGIARSGQTDELKPNVAPSELWTRACLDKPAEPGQARVAIVFDYGSPQDAPAGETPPADAIECAIVESGSTGAEALSAVATIRAEAGLICAFDGYPASECAPVISVDEPADSPREVIPDHGGTPAETGPTSDQGATAADASIDDEPAGNFATILIAGSVVLAVFVAIALVATRRRRPQ